MTDVKKSILKLEKGAVTLLDILGWKGIWQRDENAFENLKNLLSSIERTLIKVKNKEVFEDDSQVTNIFSKINTKILSISDTVAIYSTGTPKEVISFHELIIPMYLCDFLEDGLLIRGATSYGNFAVEENILIGPAIDEVASWHSKSNLIGVFLTPSALFSLDIDTSIKYPDYINTIKKKLIKIPIHIKDFGRYETYYYNWIKEWENMKHNIKDLKKIFLKSIPITPDIAIKYQNTIKVYEDIKNGVKSKK